MKGIFCLFVVFAIGMLLTQKAVSAPDTVKSAAKVDSSKTSSSALMVDKDAFTIALQSANTTIEFLKFFLGFVVSIGTLIIGGLTAYFAWQSYQNRNRIVELENRLQQAGLGISEIETKTGTLTNTIQDIEARISVSQIATSEQTINPPEASINQLEQADETSQGE